MTNCAVMNKHIPCKRCSGRGFINWIFSEGNTGTGVSYFCPCCNGSGVIIVPMTNAADVAPVVRCKDCKYFMFSDFYGECRKGYMGIVSPDDFCSYGEQRESAKKEET